MPAMDLEAPGLMIIDEDVMLQYSPVYDQNTVQMRDQLNAVTYFEPTFPPAFPIWVRSYGPGIGDDQYNVGFHQADVNPYIEPMLMRHESPDVPVTHLPYSEQLFNSTLTQATIAGQIVFNALRSPTPNEGIF